MASPGNQHCASCIGTLSFPIAMRPKSCIYHSNSDGLIGRYSGDSLLMYFICLSISLVTS